jgi:hypothetical protein
MKGKVLEGSDHGRIKVISQHLPEGTKEMDEKPSHDRQHYI